MELNSIQMNILKEIAALEGIPKGAYNIRSNGELAGRAVRGVPRRTSSEL